MALSLETIGPGCVFHSGRGIEFAAHDTRELVESAGMARSFDRKDLPLDKVTMGLLFHP